MSILVHAVSGAPIPWRVLCGLAFKGLRYEINYLQASKGEHKSPEFLKLNPRGTIPVLESDGIILRDSIAMLAWLDDQYPELPLFGDRPAHSARIWQATMETAEYLRAAQHAVFAPIFLQGKSMQSLTGAERDDALAKVKSYREELTRLEQLLDEDPFMAGVNVSAADAVAFPEIRTMQRAFETKLDDMVALGLANLEVEFPKLKAWKERVEELPGMAKTLPPHWSE